MSNQRSCSIHSQDSLKTRGTKGRGLLAAIWELPHAPISGQTGRHKAAQGYGARQTNFCCLAASASSKLAHSGSAQRSVTNHMEYVDRLLICADCNEQLFFSDKEFRNDPRRCKACRINRIDKKGAAKQGPSSRRTETRAICSQCEVETIVPFRPTNRRPVLCRQCFQSVQSSTVSPLGELALQS